MDQHSDEVEAMKSEQRCARAEIRANLEPARRALEAGDTGIADQVLCAVREYLDGEILLETTISNEERGQSHGG